MNVPLAPIRRLDALEPIPHLLDALSILRVHFQVFEDLGHRECHDTRKDQHEDHR